MRPLDLDRDFDEFGDFDEIESFDYSGLSALRHMMNDKRRFKQQRASKRHGAHSDRDRWDDDDDDFDEYDDYDDDYLDYNEDEFDRHSGVTVDH